MTRAMGWVVLVFSFGCVSEETQSLTTCQLDAARTLPTETPGGRPQQIMLDSLGRVIVAGDKRIGELTPDGTALSWSASVDNARGIFLEPTGDTLLLAGSTGVSDVFAMLLRDHGAAQTIAHAGLWDAVRIWDDPRSAGFERAPGAPSLAAFFVGGQNMLPQTRWIDTETGELCDTQRL
jgi:hypothetical protein